MATIRVKYKPEVGNQFTPYRTLPNVRFPNTMAGLAQGFAALGKSMQTAAMTGAAAEKTLYDVELLKLEGELDMQAKQLARDVDQAATGYSQNLGDIVLGKTKEFYEKLPEHLKPRFAPRIVDLQNRYQSLAFDFETKQHDAALVRGLNEAMRLQESRVVSDPSTFDDAKKKLLATIDEAALPDAQKDVLRRTAQMNLEIAKLRTEASGAYADTWLDRIHKIEGTGKNPKSSAKGHFQFIKSTWLTMMRRYAPKLASKLSESQQLALRQNYSFARQMARHYMNEIIIHFNRTGTPVTPGTTYLGWFLGPDGAARLLKKNPDTPIHAALPAQVIRANPFLVKYGTAGGVVRWAERKMKGVKGNDPYPHVPPDTKIALLAQQNQKVAVAAQADANAALAQYDQVVNDLSTSLVSLPHAEAKKQLDSLVADGSLSRAAAQEVMTAYNLLEKKRWAEIERQTTIDLWRGKADEKTIDKLIERGAPIELVKRLRKALDEGKKDTSYKSLGNLYAAVAAKSPYALEEIQRRLNDPNDPLPKAKLKQLYKEAQGQDDALTKELRDEFIKEKLTWAQSGHMQKEDLEKLLGHPWIEPETFNKLRAEVEKHDKLRKKLTDEERKGAIDNILLSVIQGNVSAEDAMRMLGDTGVRVDYETYRKLQGAEAAYKKQLKDKLEVDSLSTVLEQGAPVDPDLHKDALDAWFMQQGGTEALLSGNLDWVSSNLVTFVQKTKAVPPAAVKQISGLVLADDPKAWWTGINTMNMLAAESPQTINRQFKDEVIKEWTTTGILIKYGFKKEAVFGQIKKVREARANGSIKAVEQIAEENVKDLDVEAAIEAFDGDGSFDPKVAASMNGGLFLEDYRKAYKFLYPYFNDDGRTQEAVKEVMGAVWGTWESRHNKPGMLWGHQTRFMLLPPNKAYAPGPDGTYEWVDKWLDGIKEKHKDLEPERIVLMADRQSLEEWRQRQPVTYTGYIVTRTGVPVPLDGRLKPPAIPIKESARKRLDEVLGDRRKYEGTFLGGPYYQSTVPF